MQNIKEIVTAHAKEGWRFVQIFTPVAEGLIIPDHYEIIFERKKNNSENEEM